MGSGSHQWYGTLVVEGIYDLLPKQHMSEPSDVSDQDSDAPEAEVLPSVDGPMSQSEVQSSQATEC